MILGGPAEVPRRLLWSTSAFFCRLLMCCSFFRFSRELPTTFLRLGRCWTVVLPTLPVDE